MSEEGAAPAPALPAGLEKTSIGSLRPDTSGHDLVVKVVDSKTVQDRPARAGQKAQRVAECTVGDETGTILLSARNEQVDLATPGSYLHIRNGKIEMFRSTMRLVVDRFGTIEPAADATFEPKTEFNMSLVEYELVAVPSEPPAPRPAKPSAAPAAAAGGGEAGGEPAAPAEAPAADEPAEEAMES